MPSQKLFEQDLTTLAVLVSLGNKSFGSGLFMIDNDEIFFATARHVLFTEKIDKEKKKKSFGMKMKEIDLLYYPKNSNLKSQEKLTLDLQLLYKAKKLTINSKQDICVVKVAELEHDNLELEDGVKRVSKNLNFNAASSAMVRPYSKIDVGDQLFVIGYPKALGLKNNAQYNFNQPLVRTGIIGGKNDKKQTLIIDSPVYGGNSGGPVFIIEKHIDLNRGKLTFTNRKYLIGIVSQFIPWMNKTNKNSAHMDNSGYGVVVPFDEILKLVKSLD
ncbi:MAG: trypsin-like peptidase domain-containing protein [Flavobacteriales bacterium]